MIISITHELDLDGLGSQAIIKRYFQTVKGMKLDEIKLLYAHYTNFIDKIKRILSARLVPEHLFITDIGFNEEFKELYPIFREIIIKKCKIFWFDHHLVDEINELRLKEVLEVYLNDPKKCGAEIVKNYYLPDDPIAKKVAEFARDIDFHTQKYPIATELQSIIAFNRGNKKNENKRKIVNLLSTGIFENDWLKEQLHESKIYDGKQLKLALNHINFLEIDNFGKIAISFADLEGSRIVSELYQNFPDMKVFVGIDSRYNEVIVYSQFVNCREFASSYNGGGHENRAGFRHEKIFDKKVNEKKELNSLFIQGIKNAIILHKI